VAEVAQAIGKPLMPWQRQVADVALETHDDGSLVYSEVIVHIMRQQGKTTLQLPVMIQRCIGFPEQGRQWVTYTAQNAVKARDKLFDEHWPLIFDSPLRKLARLRKQSGHEAILWRNGSRHTLTSSTAQSGHGDTLDVGVIDEAWAYRDARQEQAMRPAMMTRWCPQLWIMSTAGEDEQGSPYLAGKVKAARERAEAGTESSIAYFEYSFAEDDDPFDPATWWRRMPAMGVTIDERTIADAMESITDEREFLRAYGNLWVPRNVKLAKISDEMWILAGDPASRLVTPPAYAVDVNPDSTWAAIGVAGRREDHLRHAELVQYERGTAWVVPRLVDLGGRWGHHPIAVEARGPAGALIPDMIAAGLEVKAMSTADVVQAHGGYYNGLVDGVVKHIEQGPLSTAVAGAMAKDIGDGAWRFSRTSSTVDICPLMATAAADWLSQSSTDAEMSVFFFEDLDNDCARCEHLRDDHEDQAGYCNITGCHCEAFNNAEEAQGG
jgi:hypothetical protein